MAAILFGFAMVWSMAVVSIGRLTAFYVVLVPTVKRPMETTMAIAIPNTNHWKSKLQKVRYSNLIGIPVLCIQAPNCNVQKLTMKH